jgi:hypothetical protein
MRNLLVGEGADFTDGESGFFGCGEDVEACSSCGALHVGVLPSLLAAGHRAAGSLGLIEDVGLDFSFVISESPSPVPIKSVPVVGNPI